MNQHDSKISPMAPASVPLKIWILECIPSAQGPFFKRGWIVSCGCGCPRLLGPFFLSNGLQFPAKKIEPLFFLDYSANMYSRKTMLHTRL